MDSCDVNGVFFKDVEELVVGNFFEVDLLDDFFELVYVSFDVDGLDFSLMFVIGILVSGGLGYY